LKHSGLSAEEAAAALSDLVATSKLVSLETGSSAGESEAWVLAAPDLEFISERTDEALSTFHAKFPLRQGMPREELRNQVGMETKPFQAVLAQMEHNGRLSSRGGFVTLSGHETRFTPVQQVAVDSLLSKFAASPYAPPSVKECTEFVGAELFASLRESGTLVAVSAEVVFSGATYEGMVRTIKVELERRSQITLADVRDLFGTSRRFAQSLLEHLDRIGVTRRIGDVRVLASPPGERSR
jgi:selenocysteine-specific elongation factor